MGRPHSSFGGTAQHDDAVIRREVEGVWKMPYEQFAELRQVSLAAAQEQAVLDFKSMALDRNQKYDLRLGETEIRSLSDVANSFYLPQHYEARCKQLVMTGRDLLLLGKHEAATRMAFACDAIERTRSGLFLVHHPESEHRRGEEAQSMAASILSKFTNKGLK